MENICIENEKKIEVDQSDIDDKVLKYKLRILIWDSPVEYINNMYGCHPNIKNEDYFTKIFSDIE